jgi:hypothetical protein
MGGVPSNIARNPAPSSVCMPLRSALLAVSLILVLAACATPRVQPASQVMTTPRSPSRPYPHGRRRLAAPQRLATGGGTSRHRPEPAWLQRMPPRVRGNGGIPGRPWLCALRLRPARLRRHGPSRPLAVWRRADGGGPLQRGRFSAPAPPRPTPVCHRREHGRGRGPRRPRPLVGGTGRLLPALRWPRPALNSTAWPVRRPS